MTPLEKVRHRIALIRIASMWMNTRFPGIELFATEPEKQRIWQTERKPIKVQEPETEPISRSRWRTVGGWDTQNMVRGTASQSSTSTVFPVHGSAGRHLIPMIMQRD
jgi:hypothetical protein